MGITAAQNQLQALQSYSLKQFSAHILLIGFLDFRIYGCGHLLLAFLVATSSIVLLGICSLFNCDSRTRCCCRFRSGCKRRRHSFSILDLLVKQRSQQSSLRATQKCDTNTTNAKTQKSSTITVSAKTKRLNPFNANKRRKSPLLYRQYRLRASASPRYQLSPCSLPYRTTFRPPCSVERVVSVYYRSKQWLKHLQRNPQNRNVR